MDWTAAASHLDHPTTAILGLDNQENISKESSGMYRSLDRDRYQKKLTKLLRQAIDEQLFTMVWSVNAVQSGRAENVLPSQLVYPTEAVTSSLSDPAAIHPWKLETLLNESLTTPKTPLHRVVNCSQFGTAVLFANILRGLENAYDGISLLEHSVFHEMGRISQRQFEWQRGFLNIPNFYRSGFIYGGPASRAFFLNKWGLTIDDFGLICFGLRSMYQRRPYIGRGGGIPDLSISEGTLELAWNKISLPYQEAVNMTKELRSAGGHISYRKSIFRMFPCVSFGESLQRIYAPLPDLLTARSTSGLYYDLVADKDAVREIGARFHEYAFELLDHFTDSIVAEKEFNYQAKKGEGYDSPDLFLSKLDNIEVIVECKATRLTYGARFGNNPIDEAAREYGEIAKAVFQIWRFVSHVRRGICASRTLSDNPIGVVLTLDTWLTMDTILRPRIIQLVDQMIIQKSADISAADRIPILFCPMDDLEVTLRESTEESFLKALRATAEPRFDGWSLWSVHSSIEPELHLDNEYPFSSRLGEVMAWAKYVFPDFGSTGDGTPIRPS